MSQTQTRWHPVVIRTWNSNFSFKKIYRKQVMVKKCLILMWSNLSSSVLTFSYEAYKVWTKVVAFPLSNLASGKELRNSGVHFHFVGARSLVNKNEFHALMKNSFHTCTLFLWLFILFLHYFCFKKGDISYKIKLHTDTQNYILITQRPEHTSTRNYGCENIWKVTECHILMSHDETLN